MTPFNAAQIEKAFAIINNAIKYTLLGLNVCYHVCLFTFCLVVCFLCTRFRFQLVLCGASMPAIAIDVVVAAAAAAATTTGATFLHACLAAE